MTPVASFWYQKEYFRDDWCIIDQVAHQILHIIAVLLLGLIKQTQRKKNCLTGEEIKKIQSSGNSFFAKFEHVIISWKKSADLFPLFWELAGILWVKLSIDTMGLNNTHCWVGLPVCKEAFVSGCSHFCLMPLLNALQFDAWTLMPKNGTRYLKS